MRIYSNYFGATGGRAFWPASVAELNALTTVEACASKALMSAGRSEKIMVLLFWPISEYIAMYCCKRENKKEIKWSVMGNIKGRTSVCKVISEALYLSGDGVLGGLVGVLSVHRLCNHADRGRLG